MRELDKEIDNLHAERCSLLASFCEFITELFGDEREEENPAD